MIVERGLALILNDGCTLRADVYRPVGTQPVPAVLERTPYGRHRCDQAETPAGGSAPRSREALAQAVVDRGYALVVQDCRGCGESGGEFEKYVHEADDGVQAQAWVAAQPWCDGRVATMGFSYGAMVQLAAACLGSLSLQAMFLDCGGFYDAHDSGIRRGGAFELKQATWALTHARRTAAIRADADLVSTLADQDLRDWLFRTPWRRGASPLAALPDQEGMLVDYWQHEAMGPFWQRPALYAKGAVDRIAHLPVFILTAWFDTSLKASIDLWQALQRQRGQAPPLLIGPWTHGNRHQTQAGDVDLGEAARPEVGLGRDTLGLRLDWFDAVLRPDGGASADGAPPVRYFEMGGGDGSLDDKGRRRHGGRWRSSSHWPPAEARPLFCWLGADRSLGPQPGAAGALSFVADPWRPVATRGGAINAGEPLMAGGAFDHGPDAGDERVLVFQSAPLPQPLCVAGPVSVRLFVHTDRPDADICVTLLDVYPDGSAYNLTDGILRLSHRDPESAPRACEPGTVLEVEVQAYPTANRFEAGHRIRVDIAGANFPRFDINPHAHPAGRHMSQARIAQSTVMTGAGHPSCLQLQVVPGDTAR